ncbi:MULTISPECIES: hypothetical protein [unclassified Novosphingobium]|uniref:hypothetical protein n=1 Tax=unclassified Novosphingobium TaxID=2644732 RepID=UPI0010621A3D|nr:MULTISPECIES: hypothetical protein [unclassified Novosphingobium]
MNFAMQESGKCDGQLCKEHRIVKIGEILNDRRQMRASLGSQIAFDKVRMECEDKFPDIDAQAACFSEKKNATFSSIPEKFKPARYGVTRAGYNQLRTKMTLGEAEWILGDDFQEVSYSSYGGYSSAMYRWGNVRRGILLIFQNEELRSMSIYGM